MSAQNDAGRQEVTVGLPAREDQFGAPTRGSARLWLTGLLALGAIAWLALGTQRGIPTTTEQTQQEQGRTASEAGAAELPAPLEDLAEGPRTLGAIEARPAGLDGGFNRVFEGTGTIAGQVSVLGGGAPPQWTVHLEPSIVSKGRDAAEPREYVAGEREETFELRDVQMGAYRIYATAPGLRSSAQEVALYKLEGQEHLPGVHFVHVSLTMRPMASVDGLVRRSNGNPAESLDVHLVPVRAVAPGEKISVTTDAAGAYRFDAVPPGAWQLRVGDPLKPFATPPPISVESKGIELDPVTLPPLVTLDIEILDESARPFPEVDIVGYLRGAGSGSLRGRTGPMGHLVVDYLPPGPWRIEATYADLGYRGRKDWVLEAGDEPQLESMVIR